MYQRILVAIEHSSSDRTILDHIEALAKLTGARLILTHVADGFAARHFDQLKLRESEEMKDDRAYLDKLQIDLTSRGFTVDTVLAAGDPATELARVAKDQNADLIALATHGHRGLADLLHGSTADQLRHEVTIPVLLLRARVSGD